MSEAIARDIVRRIGAEELAPGTQLPPEAKMLEEYRVGRGSLREALRILEVHGLISIKPGPRGGPTVDQVHTENFGRMATLYFQMDGVTFADLVEARVIMEPTIAALAAQRHDPQLLSELGRFAGSSSTDDDEYARDADEFHRLVAAMSGNPVMTLFAQSLTDILRDRLSPPLFPKSRRAAVLSVHDAIAKAVTDGDASRAEELMREHMTEYAAYVRRRHPGLMREVVDWR
ncbi:FadR/GntR family transcriptional regulator [Actinophytocola sp.]|uniref:FadR/GntR family transcriptional regulator n=1 Tax=Actinophytocola sp. TaxID=1872138 RepID=UPI002ED5F9EF